MDLRGMKTFPEAVGGKPFKITCLCMTKDVLLYGGDVCLSPNAPQKILQIDKASFFILKLQH